MSGGELGGTQMKTELKNSGHRHAMKMIKRLSEVVTLPEIAQTAIIQEFEYATLDGYRITMKHNTEMENNDDYEEESIGNR